ncbi:hypothetical protein ARMSODRAFT_1027068 [Armillaria solidipes]|uniref:DUF6589 domain-containing protein n=1 Tax=Armillaria solidipes TaxID=1076256 RepID=A0A2H3AYF2_9AGAR|nr:hypothetical protein ARMSODRAFT_1027068 [Armillaria solidipes]
MLHIIHNITHVWPKGIRDIALKNWLVNTTGQSYAFVEVDLMQEHMNYWIKLEMISPCVDILRHLTKSLNSVLGTNQGSRHAPPDLSKDIAAIMKSLKDHHVYQIKKGRVLDDDDTPVKDIIAAGLKELTDTRRCLVPVVPVPVDTETEASSGARVARDDTAQAAVTTSEDQLAPAALDQNSAVTTTCMEAHGGPFSADLHTDEKSDVESDSDASSNSDESESGREQEESRERWNEH